MRIKIIFFLCILFCGTYSYSQEREHQLSVGYALASTSQIFDVFQIIAFEIGGDIVFSDTNLKNQKSKGGIHLSYAYTPKNSWFFGATIVYNGSEYDVIANDVNYGKQSYSYYTFAGEVGLNYLKKEYFRLYGLINLGLTYTDSEFTEKESGKKFTSGDSVFDFQITPLGLSFGKKFGGFANLGFGYRGVANFGIYYRL